MIGAQSGRRTEITLGILPYVQSEMQNAQVDLDAIAIRDQLAKITVETLTPIEAMNVLYQLKQMIR